MKVIYINVGFEDYVSSENIHILLWYYVANDDEAPSTSSQIVEQTDVIKEVVLPAVSKLNDQAINKEQTQFSPSKHFRKGKWICYYLLYSLGIAPID